MTEPGDSFCTVKSWAWYSRICRVPRRSGEQFTEAAEKDETRCYHGAEAAALEQGKQDAASHGVGAAEVP